MAKKPFPFSVCEECCATGGSADLSDYVTKDEINSKLASVYKYKGSVENYSDLPTEPSVGDVYNIRNGYDVNAYAVPIKEAFCTGYGDYIEDEYGYMYLNDTSMFNDELFMNNTTFTVYAEDGEYMGSFSPDGLTDCFAEQYINGTGLCGVISNIAYKETGIFVPNEKYAVNKIYYFVGCLPTDDYITVLRINPGDNVAWTGSSWDVLAGTVDLTNYATKEEVAGLATKIIILSNTMSKDEIVTAVNTAPKGTTFDIQTSLELFEVDVHFPEESLIYSSKSGRKTINFGYSYTSSEDVWEQSYYLTFGAFSKVSDISVIFSDYGTTKVGVNFGEGCEVTNCGFEGYCPFVWGDHCTFVNCSLSGYTLYLSDGGSYINCFLKTTEAWGDGVDCSSANLVNCSSNKFKISNGEELVMKIKTLNPDMNLVDSEGNEVKGLYATSEDVNTAINTAIGEAMEGEY